MLKNKQDSFFFIALVLIQLAYFVTAILHHNYIPFIKESFFIPDSEQYVTQAKNIIDYGTSYSSDLSLPINYHFYTLRPPLYPLFLSIFYIFNASTITIFFFQNIISILSIYLLRSTIIKFNYQKKYDFIFLLLLLFTPSHFIYANLLMSEVLFQLLLVLMFRFAMFFRLYKKNIYLIAYTIILSLAAITKPAMYLFIIPSTFYLVYLSISLKKWQPIVASLIPIICIFSIFQWNYNRTNYYHYSSIQSYNLINYNTHLYLTNTKGLEFADKIVDSINNEANSLTNFGSKLKYQDRAAKSLIKQNLASYSLYHLQGSFYGFIDPGRYDLTTFFKIKFNDKYNQKKGILFHLNNYGIKGVINFLIKKYSLIFLFSMMIVLVLNTFKLFSIFLVLFNKKINTNLKFISLSLISYLVLLTGPVGASRYIMPIVPLIIGVILIDNYFINVVTTKITQWRKKQ